jgi:hypothetical protein
LDIVGKKIITACRNGIVSAKHNRTYRQILPLTSFGLKMLKSLPVAAVPADKDGGFAIMDSNTLVKAHEHILSGSDYVEIPPTTLNHEMPCLISRYRTLARRIGNWSGDPGLEAALLRSLTFKNVTATSVLKVTCKTHKPEGAATFRALHTTPLCQFMALGTWLVLMLRKHMEDSRFRHILKSSDQFAREICTIIPRHEHFFLKVDLQDFFMSGSPDELKADCCANICDSQLRHIVSESILLLLDGQYVMSPLLENRIFRVAKGSGMGLVHSGDLCDLALCNRAELCWAAAAAVWARHAVDGFWRFRDDSLTLARDGRLAELFFKDTREMRVFQAQY